MELRYGLAHDQLDEMQDGLPDLVVGIGNAPKTGFVVANIGEARPVLVSRKTTRRKRERVRVSQLESMDLIGYGPIDDPFFDAVWKFFRSHELDIRLRITVSLISDFWTFIKE